MLTVGSLFSGIGGFDLGLERAGMRVKWQVEIDPFCRAVLAKHWPEVKRYEDVQTVDFGVVERVDVLCGGFPCQPVALLGRKMRQRDARWLWPDFHRAIGQVGPRYVIVENVPGLFAGGFDSVLGGLAESGYDAEWESLPAASFGAPHIRDRVWILAYPSRVQLRRQPQAGFDGARRESARLVSQQIEVLADANCIARRAERPVGFSPQRRTRDEPVGGGWWAVEPEVGRVVDGLSGRMDRLASLGNAVVPQIAQWIGERILEAEATRETVVPND